MEKLYFELNGKNYLYDRRSGKTSTALKTLIDESNKSVSHNLYLVPNFNMINLLIKPILKQLGQDFNNSLNYIEFENGSIIRFGSLDRTNDTKGSYKHILLDERVQGYDYIVKSEYCYDIFTTIGSNK